MGAINVFVNTLGGLVLRLTLEVATLARLTRGVNTPTCGTNPLEVNDT